ncbi:CLK4-ASSOCIATING SERINE/ARGININE RICH PROTEIN, partial [Salix purpurea]
MKRVCNMYIKNLRQSLLPHLLRTVILSHNHLLAKVPIHKLAFLMTGMEKRRSIFQGMETIAKEFGVKRYGWLVYMDKKAKEEVKRQKEVIKGDPAIRKLSRKERRKASQIERERDREAGRITGTKVLHHDPYREPRRSPTYEAYSRSKKARSRSRSYSPSHSRRCTRGRHPDEVHRSKPRTPKI